MSVLLVALTACTGTSRSSASLAKTGGTIDVSQAPRFAPGPINTACTIENRRSATTQKCGCIQVAANLTLSQEQQLRAVRFFSEPELLQTVKLSDTPENERFWEDWARFADTAETLCS